MQYKTIDFSKYSSIKIGPKIDVAIINKDDLKELEGKNFTIIGSCSNTLVAPNPPPLAILGKDFNYIKIQNNTLKIGSATPSGKIASFCKKNNIGGFEFLSHLPGKLGGIVFMNAGMKEFEIFNNLKYIKLLSGIKTKDEIEFGYRYTNIKEPILEAVFDLQYGYDASKVGFFKKLRSNQPSTPSAGSCFKNPQGDYAGRLIEEVGLKGKKVGGAMFSNQHANFLVNRGNATLEDAYNLIKEAQEKVYNTFNIKLECEIVILDLLKRF